MQIGIAIVESSMELPQKIKNGKSLWLSDSTSGNILEEIQNTNLKEHMHPNIHCKVIYNCQDMEAAQISINRWMDKTTIGHLHNGILFSCKKEENFTFCVSIDGSEEHYAKWNKPVRERQIPYDSAHMWNLMKKLNWQEKWGQTHRWRTGWQLGGY